LTLAYPSSTFTDVNPQGREVEVFEQSYQAFLDTNKDGRHLVTAASNDKDPAAALLAIGLLRRLLDDLEPDVVSRARTADMSWYEIGTALGRTKQALWQSYRRPDDPRPS
jgi:hypothetical protein